MQDRIPTKPNRYAVYDDAHNFIRHEYHERADEPTQVGDALNKANLLPDDVATTLGLSGNAQVKDALLAVAPWRLLRVYDSAGSYSFSAPNGLKELGVFIVGGGGSGGAIAFTDNLGASGGGSGLTQMKIITDPVGNYPVVVGKGGVGRSATFTEQSGFDGSSSAFDGVTADGGSGGKASSGNSVTVLGGKGGQGARSVATGGSVINTTSPAFGHVSENISLSQPAYFAFNIFDNKKLLIAGGCATSSTKNRAAEAAGGPDDYGNFGSAGVAGTTNLSATIGTSYGCGGGAALVYSATATATSAAGCDGAVLIYGR